MLTTLRGWFKRNKKDETPSAEETDLYIENLKESSSDEMWRRWTEDLPVEIVGKEMTRWRQSHRDWQVVRAVNAVLDIQERESDSSWPV